ncbi:GNAT family N-acetyltransferase [Mesobacillus subterraneus]|uniref:GNAT family N-acetyltransferase n=1 Tax=Mesobacillus subterraneus TaxID=285983 RepID=A0A427TT39_9BACI|nr:GNAT family N-acetyltransferase [Mesobacillus subterraneus]RSD27519.1 GNAT family N-acetyltransferase [Mesobacillus subterraneus]
MASLGMAQLNNLDVLVSIDFEVIGNDSRRESINKAIEEDRCIVVKNGGSIAGFLIFDTQFFEQSFIGLIIIRASERRKGFATALIQYFVEISPTSKIFSSTNQSNKPIHEVFKANGFVESGYIENLDEGDPEIIYFKTK